MPAKNGKVWQLKCWLLFITVTKHFNLFLLDRHQTACAHCQFKISNLRYLDFLILLLFVRNYYFCTVKPKVMRDRFFYFCIRCCCRWTSLVGCVSLSPSFRLNLAVQVKLESCARLWLVVHLHFEGNKNWKQPFNSRLRGEQQLTTYLTVYCFSQKCFSNVLQIWDRQLLEIRSRCFSKLSNEQMTFDE